MVEKNLCQLSPPGITLWYIDLFQVIKVRLLLSVKQLLGDLEKINKFIIVA